jgi:hypothetical protein
LAEFTFKGIAALAGRIPRAIEDTFAWITFPIVLAGIRKTNILWVVKRKLLEQPNAEQLYRLCSEYCNL